MKENYCYWTVATGDSSRGVEEMIASARRVGVFKEFHVWTDQPIEGAFAHSLSSGPERADGTHQLFYLRDEVAKLDFEYSVWLDPTARFHRDPGSVLRALRGSPVHAPLLFDLSQPEWSDHPWGGATCGKICRLLREAGARSGAIYAAHPGFLIVHRDAIEALMALVFEVSELARKQKLSLTSNALLSFALHLFVGDARRHHITTHLDLWRPATAAPLQASAPAILG